MELLLFIVGWQWDIIDVNTRDLIVVDKYEIFFQAKCFFQNEL